MYVARILYPVEVLGPGKRIGIWFCGCIHKCKGCSNPELWEIQEKYETSLDNIMTLIHGIAKTNDIDGFTITGGDPFLQYEDLCLFTSELSKISDDILVYTGYTLDELKGKKLKNISILIDGRYIEELNDNSLLRGSSNQIIHIINEKFREKYESYFNVAINQIQNFSMLDGFISVGIHKPGFKSQLNESLEKRGLK